VTKYNIYNPSGYDNQLGIAICKKLGIDKNCVHSIEFLLSANEVPTITIQMYMDDELDAEFTNMFFLTEWVGEDAEDESE